MHGMFKLPEHIWWTNPQLCQSGCWLDKEDSSFFFHPRRHTRKLSLHQVHQYSIGVAIASKVRN
eukprot:12896496-Prorocentrum_lima.AAC.1